MMGFCQKIPTCGGDSRFARRLAPIADLAMQSPPCARGEGGTCLTLDPLGCDVAADLQVLEAVNVFALGEDYFPDDPISSNICCGE